MFVSNFCYGEDYDAVASLCKLAPGDVFVDVGANLGQEIQFFSQLGLVMDSYEPHPYFFDKIVCDFGHIESAKITNAAAWSENCIRQFYFKKHPAPCPWGNNHRSGGASLCSEKSNVLSNQSVKVQCIDIVDIISAHDKIKILKIDAEGAEYDILQRLVDTSLIHKPEFIFFEDHERKMRSSSSFMQKKAIFATFAKQKGLTLYSW